jgi:ribosomal 50S subunit-associated protein YjgA (DUF615 family)
VRVLQPRKSLVDQKGQKVAEKEQKFRQLAVFLEEKERQRSSKLVQNTDEAFHRLTALFPHTPEKILREMIKVCRLSTAVGPQHPLSDHYTWDFSARHTKRRR